ncbi:MAG TPA: DUF4870 domain-containing protein [Xanthomonadaceae bacterium]|jgi:uncharacterized Tic20 family protein|nr:DUF4870 domain-containing protein [Xanthomonadaceae bacterium]
MSDTLSPPPAPSGGISAEERQWAMFAHLSALLGGLLTSMFGGWGTFLGPLVIWLIKKETMPFVDDQGKEALNFNITIAIIALVMSLVFGVLAVITLGIGLIIILPTVGAFVLVWLILTIIATMKANEGVAYRYPFALRLVK